MTAKPLRASGRALLLAAALLLALACRRQEVAAQVAGGTLAELPPPADPDSPASWEPYYRAMAGMGRGFVVWESRRDGHWRIWIRDLDGSPERQLSPDEPGRDHVAAHVSPDGRHLVYLSLPAPHKDFDPLPPGVKAPLHLVRLDGDRPVEDRILVPDARPYYQNRVALWVSPQKLVYVAGDRTTRQLDLATGREEVLVPEPRADYGMLVNATHTYATWGRPNFSLYREDERVVAPLYNLRGCEPYFTADGRYGFWMAPGGHVRKLELDTGASTIVLERDSKRLPPGHGYLYYPMISPDETRLAFGASKNHHGHFEADFDIFVAPLDPETLEVTGTAVRYSFSPSQDRFPDVWHAGTELGRHRGEAPFAVTLEPDPDPAPEPWRFDFGDGSPPGSDASHVFEKAGTFRVTAVRGSERLAGEVRVDPPAPPRLLRTEVRPGGREIVAVFDEPVATGRAEVRLASGAAVQGLAQGERGREVVVRLAQPLAGRDELILGGIADRAAQPNVLPTTRVPVELAAWPGPGERLAFVFGTDGARNVAADLDTGQERSFALVAHGRARYDAYGALLPARGWFEAEELPARVGSAVREAGAFALEVTVRPPTAPPGTPRRLVVLADGDGRANVILSQRGSQANLRLRWATDADKGFADVDFGRLEPGRATHLLVSYRAGRLLAFQDGRTVLDTDAVQGDFRRWRDGARLFLGADRDGANDFGGALEGVALWARPFEAAEAAAHADAYLQKVAGREPVPRIHLEARLRARSAVPTPEHVAPYREALVVSEYEVPPDRRAELGADRVRVAQWAVLDARSQPLPDAADGKPVPLELEPFDRHPRLDATYVSDTLDPAPDLPLFLDVSP